MKTKNIILLVIIASTICITFYSLQSDETSEAYKNQIVKERRDRDDYMRNNDESPFADSVETFKGLKYFEPNEKYRIVADLIPIENKKSITLATSDGQGNTYLEYAYATFSIDKKLCRLLILEIMEVGQSRGTLFLAFADATSTSTTYGAGRYLDIKKVPGSTSITLDFNKAYNPYCAYNETFSCPFPPAENLLDVAIPVGEKVYH